MESLLDEFNIKLETSKKKDSELEERAVELSYLREKGKKMKTRNTPSVTSERLLSCLIRVQEREEVE